MHHMLTTSAGILFLYNIGKDFEYSRKRSSGTWILSQHIRQNDHEVTAQNIVLTIFDVGFGHRPVNALILIEHVGYARPDFTAIVRKKFLSEIDIPERRSLMQVAGRSVVERVGEFSPEDNSLPECPVQFDAGGMRVVLIVELGLC